MYLKSSLFRINSPEVRSKRTRTLQLATRIQRIRNYEDEFYSWKIGTIRRRRFAAYKERLEAFSVANIGIAAEDAADAI